MSSILLLGASGYIGQAFQYELTRRGADFVSLSRADVDYTSFDKLLSHLRSTRPSFLINAAGYTGKPNVDACESARAATIAGNVLLPMTIAHACSVAGVPWGHVSSGCIYNGAYVLRDVLETVEPCLTTPSVRACWEKNPAVLRGFSETDEPNFSFDRPPCSFYSGAKALGERAIEGIGSAYIWRLRIPFDEYDNARNYLSKLQRYAQLLESVNSLSHRGDFVRACLDLWESHAPMSIYNVTNPGWVTTRQVVTAIQKYIPSTHRYDFFDSDEQFYATAAQTPRSNCVMDVSKLLSTGVRMRPVEDALEDALRHWQPEGKTVLAA